MKTIEEAVGEAYKRASPAHTTNRPCLAEEDLLNVGTQAIDAIDVRKN